MMVSTLDQYPETPIHDLHEMTSQRGYQIVEQYIDMISGAKARRPELDAMMRDARRPGQFDVVLAWACDRIARSVKHFLDVLDELNRLNIEFVSFREQIDTAGPLGRAVVVIIGAIRGTRVQPRSSSEVRAACGGPSSKAGTSGVSRLFSIEMRSCGDRQQGHNLGQLAKSYLVSRTTIHRVLTDQIPAVTMGSKNRPRKPRGIKGWSHPIRLLHNVWVMKQTKKLSFMRTSPVYKNDKRHTERALAFARYQKPNPLPAVLLASHKRIPSSSFLSAHELALRSCTSY